MGRKMTEKTMMRQAASLACRLRDRANDTGVFANTAEARAMGRAATILLAVLGENGIDGTRTPTPAGEPISQQEAEATAERLYRGLVDGADDHQRFRLAQAMNRAWAALTANAEPFAAANAKEPRQ